MDFEFVLLPKNQALLKTLKGFDQKWISDCPAAAHSFLVLKDANLVFINKNVYISGFFFGKNVKM